MEILPYFLPHYSTKISDSCLIQLCWRSLKPYYLQVTLLRALLQSANPKPCPSSFSSQLLCKHLPYIIHNAYNKCVCSFLQPLPKSSAGELQVPYHVASCLCGVSSAAFLYKVSSVASRLEFSGTLFALSHVACPYGTNMSSGKQ